MITPAMAADYSDGMIAQNAAMENAMESYSVVRADDYDVWQLSNGSENVDVKIMTTDKVINDRDIKQAYYYAQMALQEEVNAISSETSSELFDYTLILDDIVYFYERKMDDPDNTTMEVYQVSQEDLSVLATELDQYEALLEEQEIVNDSVDPRIAVNSFELNDGFGGKVVINNTSNKYLSFNVELPTVNEVAWSNTPQYATPIAYIYGGFEGGNGVVPGTTTAKKYSSDIGLQYSSTHQVWKPFLNIERYTYSGKALTGYNNVHTNNGFLPSANTTNRRTVSITIHVNNDQSNGLKGSVRLKATGMAKYPNANSSGAANPTNLTAILESATSDQSTGVVKALNITSVANYKLLCLIALGQHNNVPINDDDKTTGKNWCRYSNVNIGGSTVSSSNMSLYQEHAVFSGVGNGKVTIWVNK